MKIRTVVLCLIVSAVGCTRIYPPLERAELETYANQYLDAVVARDPGLAPIAGNAIFTENGQRLDIGDGLWNTASARGSYAIYVADTVSNQIGFIGTIRENDVPAIFGMRLKIDQEQIIEIETFVARSDSEALLLEALDGPHPVFTQYIPPSERATREELVVTANKYFNAVERNDGKGEYPFTDDCNRLENGKQTTNNPSKLPRPFDVDALGCREQFETGFFRFVTRIRDRRFVVVDQARGLVFAFAFFDHAGNIPRVTLTNGMEIPIGVNRPWTWEIVELFKMENGLISQIEALYRESPYGMNSGWSTWQDGLSEKIQFNE